MAFDSLERETQKLIAAAEVLAAVGAELRLRRDGGNADPRLRHALRGVIEKIDSGGLESITEDQVSSMLGVIDATFRQAFDLLNDPARELSWAYADKAILQSQGHQSRRVVRSIDALALERPDLQAKLRSQGIFLDVGTGVGELAMEAARSWPAWSVVGLDIWEPALKLARANLTGSGLESRIELRTQSIEQLQDEGRFSLAWLPGRFIPQKVVPIAIGNVYRALVEGGWLVFGLTGATPESLLEPMNVLKVLRMGGHPWSMDEIAQQFQSFGFQQVDFFTTRPPNLFVVGQKPTNAGSP